MVSLQSVSAAAMPAAASAALVDILRKLRKEDTVNAFFQDLETIPFPTEALRRLYPELVAEWEVVAKLESVPWAWVALLELSLSGFLAPTACLYPLNSIQIFALTWPFLLHPGSTQTSGLLRLYQDVLDEIEIAINAWRAEAAAGWARDNPAPGGGVQNPFAGSVSLSLGSGSLEGEGKVASQRQNLGRTCAFLTEGKRWFNWLQAEGTLNETIVTELYERAKWRRVTLDGTRSFTLMYPYFGVVGSVHLPDIAFLWGQEDALGIRGRARFLYTRPSFKRALELREANAEHNADRSLTKRLVERFLPIHRAHSLDHTARGQFEFSKGYPFRVYTLSMNDGAQTLFEETFDHHVQQQEDNYLEHHTLAKQHGKKKTSNLRFALQVHMREQARLGRNPDAWSLTVPRAAVEFSQEFGRFLDLIGDKLDSFFASLVERHQPAAGLQVVAPTGAQRFRDLAATPLDVFQSMTLEHRKVYVRLLKHVFTQTMAWLTGSALRNFAVFKDSMEELRVNPGEADDYVCRVGALLHLTCLGTFQVSSNKSGPRNFFFIKRALVQDASMVHFVNILHAFGLQPSAYSGQSLEQLRQLKPKTAVDPSFPDLPDAGDVAALVQGLRALVPPA